MSRRIARRDAIKAGAAGAGLLFVAPEILAAGKSPKREDLIPPWPGHHREWIIAAKTGKPTLCNFDCAGALIEHNLLALVAYRVGKRLEWDAGHLKAVDCPEADAYIRKKYREGWVLDG